MKIKNITLQERILWIVGAGLIAFHAENQLKRVDDMQTLLTTYQMETRIQDQQVEDFAQQLYALDKSEYNRGFEDGKTQAAVVLMNKGSLYNYSDGYHAAISQLENAEGGFEDQAIIDLLLSDSFEDNKTEIKPIKPAWDIAIDKVD